MFVNDLNQKIPLFFLSVPKGKFKELPLLGGHLFDVVTSGP